MSLPSFKSPPFLLSNYSHFGSALNLHYSNGISSKIGIPYDPQSHSLVTHFFSIYDAHFVNNFTRIGNWGINDIGKVTTYFEFMLEPGTNYAYPLDFIRLHKVVEKFNTGPISPSNPVAVKVRVETGQLGIVYTYPTYYLTSLVTPEAGILLNIGQSEGGFADVNVQWNDVVNGEWFTHNINNYPFSPSQAGLWRYHARLNVEAYSPITVIVDYQLLTVLSTLTPFSITSEESFGNFTVEAAETQNISLNSIGSEEYFGVPQFSNNLNYIILPSILSQEAFGNFTVKNLTKVDSGLPKLEPAKEGDILLTLDPLIGYGEMSLDDRDVDRDPEFETSILTTIGTDRERNQDDIPPDSKKTFGGWWADSVPVVGDDKIGTRLWLLRRAKTDNELINRAQEYLIEGFNWMIEDKVIDEFKATVWIAMQSLWINNTKTIGMELVFVRPSNNTQIYKYYYNWEYELLRRG